MVILRPSLSARNTKTQACHGNRRHGAVVNQSGLRHAQLELAHQFRNDHSDRIGRHRKHQEHHVRQPPECSRVNILSLHNLLLLSLCMCGVDY